MDSSGEPQTTPNASWRSWRAWMAGAGAGVEAAAEAAGEGEGENIVVARSASGVTAAGDAFGVGVAGAADPAEPRAGVTVETVDKVFWILGFFPPLTPSSAAVSLLFLAGFLRFLSFFFFFLSELLEDELSLSASLAEDTSRLAA